jgi:hypothetical protein
MGVLPCGRRSCAGRAAAGRRVRARCSRPVATALCAPRTRSRSRPGQCCEAARATIKQLRSPRRGAGPRSRPARPRRCCCLAVSTSRRALPRGQRRAAARGALGSGSPIGASACGWGGGWGEGPWEGNAKNRNVWGWLVRGPGEPAIGRVSLSRAAISRAMGGRGGAQWGGICEGRLALGCPSPSVGTASRPMPAAPAMPSPSAARRHAPHLRRAAPAPHRRQAGRGQGLRTPAARLLTPRARRPARPMRGLTLCGARATGGGRGARGALPPVAAARRLAPAAANNLRASRRVACISALPAAASAACCGSAGAGALRRRAGGQAAGAAPDGLRAGATCAPAAWGGGHRSAFPRLLLCRSVQSPRANACVHQCCCCTSACVCLPRPGGKRQPERPACATAKPPARARTTREPSGPSVSHHLPRHHHIPAPSPPLRPRRASTLHRTSRGTPQPANAAPGAAVAL